jgi:hypothetical protein
VKQTIFFTSSKVFQEKGRVFGTLFSKSLTKKPKNVTKKGLQPKKKGCKP